MRARRTDANHQEVVRAFRKFGCSVLELFMVGNGCPDILVAKNKKQILVEIKQGTNTPSKKRLTLDEEKFYNEWQGLIVVVENLSDVIAVVKALEK